jgi:hypothetical protein
MADVRANHVPDRGDRVTAAKSGLIHWFFCAARHVAAVTMRATKVSEKKSR